MQTSVNVSWERLLWSEADPAGTWQCCGPSATRPRGRAGSERSRFLWGAASFPPQGLLLLPTLLPSASCAGGKRGTLEGRGSCGLFDCMGVYVSIS